MKNICTFTSETAVSEMAVSETIKSSSYEILRWWDRHGENEIDMIAENELMDRATFFEIKRQKDDISLGVLKQKTEVFLQTTHQFKGYKISYKGLSMEEM